MNFPGHAIGAGAGAAGLMIGLLLVKEVSAATALYAGAVFWVGGQFPDLDVGSIPGRWFGRLGFLVAGVCFALGVSGKISIFMTVSAVIGLIALFLMGMKHRGPTHKYWLPVFLILMAVLGVFPETGTAIFIGAFAGGIILHLILDGIFPWSFKGWFL